MTEIKIGDTVYLTSEGLWENHEKLVVQATVTGISSSHMWVSALGQDRFGGLWTYPRSVFLTKEDALHSAQSMLGHRRSNMLLEIDTLQRQIEKEKILLHQTRGGIKCLSL